uniref:DDE Tnp4 domain-containing protein n=1 Tax=Xenopus tropicalis TaxID=8364 RepID=A0A803JJM1_XENTR
MYEAINTCRAETNCNTSISSRSFEDLKFTTGISAQALGRIIPETCHAIIESLKADYLKFPSTEVEWKSVAKQFEDYWNFPNCLGAIDGKHVRIQTPTRSGSYYFNYKGYFSIVLLAIVNAKYEFLMVDVGKNGRVSDGGAMEQTFFYQQLQNDQLHLPSNSDSREGLNYAFVADEAFALHKHILKPFPQKHLTMERRIFNYRLSRARRVVENAFGILANRF